MACNVRDNALNDLKSKRYIDNNSFVINAMFFDENNRITELAKSKYGVKNNGRAFITTELPSGKVKAIANQDFFDELQKKHDDYQLRNLQQGSLFQLEKPSLISSKASPGVIALVKDLLKNMGVNYEGVSRIIVDGKKMNSNGAAIIMQKLVQVVNGKEATALPEEAMHFVVEIVKQTNPTLYQKLLKEINSYKVLNEVYENYGTDPAYQINGKPNIQKLKDEAIAKVLVEKIINQMEGSTEKPELLAKVQTWWDAMLNWIKSLFVRSGFDEAAFKIISGEEIGTAEDIRAQEGEYFLQQSEQDRIYNRIKTTKDLIDKRGEEGYFDKDGKKIPRVSDLIKDWYDQVFADKALTDSEYQKALNDLRAEKGTDGHKDLENIFNLFVDEDGYLRDQPLDDSGYVSLLNPYDRTMYETLKENLHQRLLSLDNSPVGRTRFVSEAIIYNSKVRGGRAGTVDFMAIKADGKVSILDWKFMDLNIEKYEDVPWYKVNAWNQQMQAYKNILEQMYDIKPADFEQTRMIPILALYSKGNAKENILPTLLGVRIGDVDAKKINEAYLVPVGLEAEKTGIKKIDTLLEKLNATYKKLSEKKAIPSEKQSKAEQLNALYSAIRQLQMRQNVRPLIYQASVFNKKVRSIISTYESKFVGKDPKSFSDDEISNFYLDIETALYSLETYTDLDIELKSLFQKDLTEEDKKIKEDLKNTVDEARDLLSDLRKVGEDFTNEIIAASEGIEGILNPEKVIRGITRWFASTSTIQLKSVQVLFKKANRALGFAAMDTVGETNNLARIKDAYDKWAQARGLNLKNYFDIIAKKDDNELIDEFSPEFYKELKKKTQDKDYQWIRDNVDVAAYREYLEQEREKEYQRIESKPENILLEETPENAESNAAVRRNIQFQKIKADELYDISGPESVGWLLYKDIKKFPKRETWESAEWKTLTKPENAPALEFYNYIRKKNEEYADIGYISKAEARVFLPFIRKGVTEKLIFGGNVTLGEQFLRSITVDEGDIGFGKIDPQTGRPIDKIPRYFTKEIDGELSRDLFRTMALYNEMAIKYKYVSQIEAQVRALATLERNKKAIATSWYGKTRTTREGTLEYTKDNTENTQLLEDMIKGIIYGQKYLESQTFDQLLGKVGEWAPKINKALGIKLLDEDMTGRQVSLNKLITNINNNFQMISLGLNPLSAISNLFGGSAQSIINSGKYFTKNDFTSSEMWLTLGKMRGGEDRKKFVAALQYFLPLTENYNKEIAKDLSLSKLSQENIQEFLMILMRNSDFLVQTANFRSFLKNTVVEGDQLVNAREFVRAKEKYANRYKVTPEQRKKLDEEFEAEVKQLIEEKGVMKLAKIENNQLVIPGVEQKSESVIDIRRKVQALTKNALGNLSEDDIRLINLNIYGKSFMVFKNWIPRPADVRFGNLKYNVASDAYEWGRMRMVFRIIGEDVLKSVGRLKDALEGNEKGVEYMRQLFEKKKTEYKEDTGKDLDMNEAEFMDLVRQNIKSQLLDTLFLLTLMALYLGLKAAEPDDEEDPVVRNRYKFLLRATDKLRDELMYFYNPTSIQGLISTGFFPSMRLLDNYGKLVTSFSEEMFGMTIGDEERVEKAHPIKYLMKSFPITNVGQAYIPMFSPELAKDLGIRVQSQSGIR